VLGTPSGKLVQYTPEGVAKAEIPTPPELETGFYPTFVHWLENDLFLAAYAQEGADPADPLEVFVIHRNKEALSYTKFFDPNDTMGVPGRSGAFRLFAGLKAWGGNTKHLTFLVSGLASEVAVLHGQPAQDKEAPAWQTLILEETARAIMPAAKKGVCDDTSAIGLELDLTSDKPIRRGIVGGVELPDLPPAPRLLVYSQEGFIISFVPRQRTVSGHDPIARYLFGCVKHRPRRRGGSYAYRRADTFGFHPCSGGNPRSRTVRAAQGHIRVRRVRSSFNLFIRIRSLCVWVSINAIQASSIRRICFRSIFNSRFWFKLQARGLRRFGLRTASCARCACGCITFCIWSRIRGLWSTELIVLAVRSNSFRAII
jgi:hypothetical protein